LPPNFIYADRLIADFGLVPVTAAEIEFYLEGGAPAASFWQAVSEKIPIVKYEKERGEGQYEIALPPCADPAKTAADIVALKDIIIETAATGGMKADFSAKPFAGQPGSGLHIHIHLEDAQGKNVFYKDDATISDALKWSIGGLLAWLPETMPVFAPYPESYARFAPGGHAPTTVSWGANNRTVAIRLPDKPHDKKHIEHRVAGADADPYAVIGVILAAMHDGLTRRLDPGPQIYGDASLAMYNLPPLPSSLNGKKG
jgi:glutamine synthetase